MKNYLIKRFKPNTDIFLKIKGIAIKNKIGFAKIDGLGMLHDPVIGFLENGKYHPKQLKGKYELISLNGTIAYDLRTNEPIIHIHTVISNSEFKCYGGHLISSKVGFTLDLFLTQIQEEKIYVKFVNDNLCHLDI